MKIQTRITVKFLRRVTGASYLLCKEYAEKQVSLSDKADLLRAKVRSMSTARG